MNFLIFFYFFTFSANFSKIDIFHRSQFWALCNNKNEFSRGQREGDGGRDREGGKERERRRGGEREKEGWRRKEGEGGRGKKGVGEREQVIQGSHMVSGTRCPAWSD